MPVKKSKYKSGQLLVARPLRFNRRPVLVTLIRYIPNYDWEIEYTDSNTGEVKRDTFDEREFDS